MNPIDKIKRELQDFRNTLVLTREEGEQLFNPDVYQITLKPIKKFQLKAIVFFLRGKDERSKNGLTLDQLGNIGEKATKNLPDETKIYWCLRLEKRKNNKLQKVYFYGRKK